MIDLPDRFRGALLGLAVGDAVGTTNEFSRNPPPISDMVGGGPFALLAGQWTDDTSMALCLAESLIECRGFDAADQMDRYLKWWRHGYNSVTGRCFDIGNTTRAALQRYETNGDPYAGDPSPAAAGNGSLMRLAPVPLYFWQDTLQSIFYAAESSKTTHAAPQAVDACRYFAAVLSNALAGSSKDTILAPTTGKLHPEVQSIAEGTHRRKSAGDIIPSGYVVDSLEAALYCFCNTDTFRDGCLMAANLGGDADTIAAIYGQVAGAFYGETGIPESWLERLAWKDRITVLADLLLSAPR